MSTFDLLVGTHIDRPDLLPSPRPPLMKRMCGRCQLVLGWKICVPEMGGAVTTGICEACLEITLEETLDEVTTF